MTIGFRYGRTCNVHDWDEVPHEIARGFGAAVARQAKVTMIEHGSWGARAVFSNGSTPLAVVYGGHEELTARFPTVPVISSKSPVPPPMGSAA